MRKVLLIILIILVCVSGVGAEEIIIGCENLGEISFLSGFPMAISFDNPASIDSRITEVNFILEYYDTNVYVFTCYESSEGKYTSRDYQFLGEYIDAGLVTREVDIEVKVGDYIGLASDRGMIGLQEIESSGYTANLEKGTQFPFSDLSFPYDDVEALSLNGMIAPPPPPSLSTYDTLPVTSITSWNSATIGSWNTALWKALERYKFTIDHTKIGEDLEHFPVTVILTEDTHPEYFDRITDEDDFDKVTFYTDDELELYADCEMIDIDNGQAVYHVSNEDWTISKDTDTIYYLGFLDKHNEDYVGLTGSEAAQEVWDSNYKAVYHMQDATTSTIKDATSNENHGTKKGSNEPIQTTGKVGYAQEFDGVNDAVNIAHSTTLNMQNFTLECVTYPTKDNDFRTLLGKWEDSNNKRQYQFIIAATHLLRFFISDTGGWDSYMGDSSTSYVPINNYTYLVVSYDGSTKKGWIDKVQEINVSYDKGVYESNTPAYIGGYTTGGMERYFGGIIDETRISNIARSSHWISATYDSLWDNLQTSEWED